MVRIRQKKQSLIVRQIGNNKPVKSNQYFFSTKNYHRLPVAGFDLTARNLQSHARAEATPLDHATGGGEPRLLAQMNSVCFSFSKQEGVFLTSFK
jgi:hypothetical protein